MSTRVIRGVVANVVGQVINLIIQIGSLPLFLHKWSLTTYGTWLLISAVPAYFLLGDFGIVSAAGTRMAMCISRNEAEDATIAFQTAVVFVLGVSGALAVAIIAGGFLATPWLSTLDERLGFVLLGMAVLVSLCGSLIEITFRATDRYAYGMTIFHSIRLAEWGGMIAGLFVWGTFTGVAAAGLTTRLLATFWALSLSKAIQSDIRWGVRHASKSELASIIRPGLAMLAFPLSFSFLLQGTTLIVGRALGASEVAVFTIYRTIARLTIQAAGIYSNALWTEFSRAFGHGGSSSLSPIYRRSVHVGILSAVIISTLLYVLFPLILSKWAHGAVPFRSNLAIAMVVYAAISSVSLVPRIALLATNHHSRLSVAVLVTACVTLLVAAMTRIHRTSFGITLVLVASEAAMCLTTYWFAKRLISTKLKKLPTSVG